MQAAKKHSFEISEETLRLVDYLRDVEAGDFVSYNEMDALLDMDVRESGRLSTARHILLRDEKIVFGTVRNEGIRRLRDAEIVHTGDDYRRRIGRTAHRGVKTTTCADMKNLSEREIQKQACNIMTFSELKRKAALPRQRVNIIPEEINEEQLAAIMGVR